MDPPNGDMVLYRNTKKNFKTSYVIKRYLKFMEHLHSLIKLFKIVSFKTSHCEHTCDPH